MSVFQRVGKVISSHIRDIANRNSKEDQSFTKHYEYQQATDHSSHNQTDERESQYRANLEVNTKTNIKGIRASYKTLMKKYHPDLHAADQNKRETAEQITKKLNEAMNYFEKKYKK